MMDLWHVTRTFYDNDCLTYSFNLFYHDNHSNETTIHFTRTGRNLIILGLETAIAIELAKKGIKPHETDVDYSLTYLWNFANVSMSWDNGANCYKVFAECVVPTAKMI